MTKRYTRNWTNEVKRTINELYNDFHTRITRSTINNQQQKKQQQQRQQHRHQLQWATMLNKDYLFYKKNSFFHLVDALHFVHSIIIDSWWCIWPECVSKCVVCMDECVSVCVLEMLRSSDLDWCNTCFRFIRIYFYHERFVSFRCCRCCCFYIFSIITFIVVRNSKETLFIFLYFDVSFFAPFFVSFSFSLFSIFFYKYAF